MSEEIKFDPSIHMLKVEAEQVISSRISKFSEKLNIANESLSSLQGRYDEAANRLAMVDTLQEQVNSLQANLTTERSHFSRQNHLSAKGIGTDLSIRSGFENQFEQHIAGITEGEKPDFNSWLDGITQNPETAPALLRSHIPQNQAPQAPQAPQAQPAAIQEPQTPPPNGNAGVVTPSGYTKEQIHKRALSPEGWAMHREQIARDNGWMK